VAQKIINLSEAGVLADLSESKPRCYVYPQRSSRQARIDSTYSLGLQKEFLRSDAQVLLLKGSGA